MVEIASLFASLRLFRAKTEKSRVPKTDYRKTKCRHYNPRKKATVLEGIVVLEQLGRVD